MLPSRTAALACVHRDVVQRALNRPESRVSASGITRSLARWGRAAYRHPFVGRSWYVPACALLLGQGHAELRPFRTGKRGAAFQSRGCAPAWPDVDRQGPFHPRPFCHAAHRRGAASRPRLGSGLFGRRRRSPGPSTAVASQLRGAGGAGPIQAAFCGAPAQPRRDHMLGARGRLPPGPALRSAAARHRRAPPPRAAGSPSSPSSSSSGPGAALGGLLGSRGLCRWGCRGCRPSRRGLGSLFSPGNRRRAFAVRRFCRVGKRLGAARSSAGLGSARRWLRHRLRSEPSEIGRRRESDVISAVSARSRPSPPAYVCASLALALSRPVPGLPCRSGSALPSPADVPFLLSFIAETVH